MAAAVAYSLSPTLSHSCRHHFSDRQKKAAEWRTLARISSAKPRKSKGITMSWIDKGNKLSNYSRVFTTNNPLYESNEALFDRYLDNTTRVLSALFPDEEKQQIEENCWRVKMIPVQVLFLKPRPVIEMKVGCKSGGQGYPLQVPKDVTKILEIDMTKFEMEGLNFKLNNFKFNCGGVIYPDRKQPLHQLRSRLEMKISYSRHPVIPLFPEQIITNIFEKHLVPYMNQNLLRDYDKYQAEQEQSSIMG